MKAFGGEHDQAEGGETTELLTNSSEPANGPVRRPETQPETGCKAGEVRQHIGSFATDAGKGKQRNGCFSSSVSLDIDPLGNLQSVIDFDAEIADRALNLGVTKKKLDGS